MAQVDVKWPSEDEDFDAVSQASTAATAEKPAQSVTVQDGDQPAEPAETSDNEASISADSANQSEPAEVKADESGSSGEPAGTPGDISNDKPEETPPEPADKPASSTPAPVVTDKPAAAKSGGVPMWRWIVEAVLLALVIGLALWAWTLHSDKTDLQSQLSSVQANPQALVQKQTDDLINKVGQLINLPTGETPTVANVTDAAKAKAQSAFFANAQNGDKVLMYVKAGEAILYRPSTNKIILVAPLTFSNTPSAIATGSPSTSSKTSTGH